MIFGNMGDMVKMARDMQGKMKQVKKELENSVFESSSNGINIKISGDMEIKEVSGLGENDKKVKDAVNKALKTAKDEAAKKMKGVTGGMNLPGMS
ncbi:MAG: YbaB/EbfC family nucleoid-associated protein [Candidatus Margulisiibacteriota bacterium]|nr:YbaB/EbfC family nucleoid-associated protein [Candidatus Margulisiibacteriota bacterium]